MAVGALLAALHKALHLGHSTFTFPLVHLHRVIYISVPVDYPLALENHNGRPSE